MPLFFCLDIAIVAHIRIGEGFMLKCMRAFLLLCLDVVVVGFVLGVGVPCPRVMKHASLVMPCGGGGGGAMLQGRLGNCCKSEGLSGRAGTMAESVGMLQNSLCITKLLSSELSCSCIPGIYTTKERRVVGCDVI